MRPNSVTGAQPVQSPTGQQPVQPPTGGFPPPAPVGYTTPPGGQPSGARFRPVTGEPGSMPRLPAPPVLPALPPSPPPVNSVLRTEETRRPLANGAGRNSPLDPISGPMPTPVAPGKPSRSLANAFTGRSAATGRHPIPPGGFGTPEMLAETAIREPLPDLDTMDAPPELPASMPQDAPPARGRWGRNKRREPEPPAAVTTTIAAVDVPELDDQRKKIDATLARFSAVHDEMIAEEKKRQRRWSKLMPWLDNQDSLDDYDGPGAEAVQKLQKLRRNPKFGKAMRATVIAAAVLMVAGVGGGIAVKSWMSGGIDEVAALQVDKSKVRNAAAQTEANNYLIVSTDGQADKSTMMVVHMPAQGRRAVVVAFPPNLSIDNADCERWNLSDKSYKNERLAASQNVSLGQAYSGGGPKCLTQKVTDLTGLSINHFLSLDVKGYPAIATALGGVDVCSNNLNGDQALQFAKGTPAAAGAAGPDSTTVAQRQQQLLLALLRKSADKTVFDLGGLRSLRNALGSFSYGENVGMDGLRSLGSDLNAVPAENVRFVPLPTQAPEESTGQVKPAPNETNSLFNALIDGTPLPGDTKSADGSGEIRVQVLNGSAKDGAGQQVADGLRSAGFVVVRTDNSSTGAKTVVRFSSAMSGAAQKVLQAVPGSVPEEDPALGGAIQLRLGQDFAGEIKKPAGGGSAGAVGLIGNCQ
ncbi:hypothetical protein D5S17_18465 [Pseudonocardiaceae bacterium YIM PH 21723]|nr:hypothetical protein D5S17_18465 [Pseudonocardiaceae bacterium YIM PH 21723]